MSERGSDGRFAKGSHSEYEFKKGCKNWRPHQPFREYDWLHQEYITKQRSTGEIAADFDVTESAIRFWLVKHNIPRRSTSEAREIKQWGLPGESNGMFGKYGEANPHWKGGITPERQAFYSSIEWKRATAFVWERDGEVCQRCRKTGIKLHIHHIVPISCKELRCEPSNLIVLCTKCHGWVHGRKNVNKEYIRD